MVEVLIALIITLVLFLALMQSALLSTSVNVNNLIRNEAVRIANMRMTELRCGHFDDLTAGTVIEPEITRNFRNFTISFTPTVTITDLPAVNPTAKQIRVSITWTFKNATNTHSITTIKRKT
ncbi:MAG: hypothetical protein GXO95_02660 [Nitrospirae bacterium]|nr:hypothetical protein [Nitrospirota bacterium]